MRDFFVVGIKNLQITCFIGVLDREKKKKQDLFFDIKVKIKQREKKTKDLHSTLDYREIQKICEKLAENRYELLETFAEDCVEKFSTFKQVLWVEICIKKPSAMKKAEYCFVQMQKEFK